MSAVSGPGTHRRISVGRDAPWQALVRSLESGGKP